MNTNQEIKSEHRKGLIQSIIIGIMIVAGLAFAYNSYTTNSQPLYALLIGLLGAFGARLYFAPSLIAAGKQYKWKLFVSNLLLGWTFFGWVIAFSWAIKEDK